MWGSMNHIDASREATDILRFIVFVTEFHHIVYLDNYDGMIRNFNDTTMFENLYILLKTSFKSTYQHQ